MKVLHVIDHLGLGGAPLFVKNLVERLAESGGIEATVCALRPHPTAVSPKVPTVTLKYHRNNLSAFRGIREMCSSHAVDIVHVHLEKSIISTLIAGKGCCCPIVVHEHGGILRHGTGALYRTALRCLGARASSAIANSEATRRALINIGAFQPQTIVTMPSFIDMDRFSPVDRPNTSIRRRYGVDHCRTVIGFAGRLEPCKGADRVILALEELRRRGNNCCALIVGDGRERRSLEKTAARLGVSESVVFTGAIDNPEEPMSVFDIALVPSRRESFGRVCVELMAMGVPVVATSVGGLPELVHHRQTGMLVDESSPETLATAVQLLLGGENLRDTIRRNAIRQACRFDGTLEVTKLRTLYERLRSEARFSSG